MALSRVITDRNRPTRVLVTGARGMVGRSWSGLLTSHGLAHRALTRAELDLADLDAVGSLDLAGVDLVVNAAAWTDVDGAERDLAGASRINGEAVGVLASRCAEAGATLLHYSTDYVFSGRAHEPYPVDAPTDPVNAYGASKLAGERAIAESGCDHLIIRTSWVYAPWGRNFVRTIANLCAQRDELKVVSDQRGRPTSAEQLARTSLALLFAGARGVWHASDDGDCTWHGFATEIARLVGSSCRVHPCTTDEFPRPAARPAWSVLDIEPTRHLIGPLTPWQISLADTIRRLPLAD